MQRFGSARSLIHPHPPLQVAWPGHLAQRVRQVASTAGSFGSLSPQRVLDVGGAWIHCERHGKPTGVIADERFEPTDLRRAERQALCGRLGASRPMSERCVHSRQKLRCNLACSTCFRRRYAIATVDSRCRFRVLLAVATAGATYASFRILDRWAQSLERIVNYLPSS